MTPEAQRIAIAEACGWRCVASFKDAFACWVRPEGADYQTEWLPNYLYDLNEIHEAEKTLSKKHHWSYISQLINLTGAGWTDVYEEVMVVAHATAAQRSEALLRTLNLWDDSK